MNFGKVLLINPFGIGDVLFTTPLVSNLRRHNPGGRIVYLANRRCAEFLRHNPKIDKVVVYERDEFVRDFRRKWTALYREIRAERFDAVFDFSMKRNLGFFCQMAGIPLRIGYNFRNRGLLLNRTWPLQGYEGRHIVEYYLDLLRNVGVPVQAGPLEMPLPATDEQWAAQWLKNQGIAPGQRLVAVVPGGGGSWGREAKYKRWPAEKFAHLIDKIIAELEAIVILFGDAKEEPLCQEVARLARFPVHSAVGQTSLTQMAALLGHCRLAVANDGGPLHVAAAAGSRTVGIFGPVDEAAYGVYPPQGHEAVFAGLPCRPCYRNFRISDCSHLSCLRDLAVESVFEKVKRKAQSNL